MQERSLESFRQHLSPIEQRLVVHHKNPTNWIKAQQDLYVLPKRKQVDWEIFDSEGISFADFLFSKGVSLQDAISYFPNDIVPDPLGGESDIGWGVALVKQLIPFSTDGLGRLSTIARMPLSYYVSEVWPTQEFPKLVAQFIPNLRRL